MYIIEMKYHAYDGLKGKNDIDRIFVFSFAQSKTCSTIFLFFFYYLLILLCIQVHYGQKNEFALHNSHIPQLKGCLLQNCIFCATNCCCCWFSSLIYKIQMPIAICLLSMLGVIVWNMKINFDTRYTWHWVRQIKKCTQLSPG